MKTDSNITEKVTGIIERVTFHNSENGFSVLRVKTSSKKDLITIIGSAINVNVGEYLECYGNWVNDKTHGLQFKAELVKIAQPTTIEGLEKYLGSGLIKGIGPGFAKRLIKAFGLAVLQVIEDEPNKLTTIDGIGDKRKETILQSWSMQKKIREIIMFLSNYGIGTTRAVRIYKAYGEHSIQKIQENPYDLVLDVRGIGFKTADVLAIKLGIPSDSIIRGRAGVRHILQEFSSNGHCAAEINTLIQEAVKLLEIDEHIIKQAIDLDVIENQLALEKIEDKTAIFLTRLYNAEKSVAKLLQRLYKGNTKWHDIDLTKAIKYVEANNNINLSTSQIEAIKTVIQNKVVIITGGPGVGKTTLVKSILKIVTNKTTKILLCAPTGRAAKKLTETTGIEAKTIHRMLEIDMRDYTFKHNEKNPLACELMVVDEISMVDILMMNNLLRAIPQNSALILVGDVDQLPSVGPGAVLDDLIKSSVISTIKLTEIFRQAAHSKIILNAHRINKGLFPSLEMPDTDLITDFYFIQENEPEKIQQKLMTMVAKRIPDKFNLCPKQQIQILTPMNRGILGASSLNVALQELLNNNNMAKIVRYGTTFSIGDKVIQTINNYDKDVFNGDIGFITQIDLEDGIIIINFDGREVEYDPHELDEISLAYAITIHKSQGSEYPAVVMPLAMQHFMLLERNLIYTGLTRAKKLVVIIGQVKALAMAIKNKKSSKRLTNLAYRLKEFPST